MSTGECVSRRHECKAQIILGRTNGEPRTCEFNASIVEFGTWKFAHLNPALDQANVFGTNLQFVLQERQSLLDREEIKQG